MSQRTAGIVFLSYLWPVMGQPKRMRYYFHYFLKKPLFLAEFLV